MDRNDLAYWFPKLLDAGVPVPRTEIVQTDANLSLLLEGVKPKGFDEFLERLGSAVRTIGKGGPVFLRTGHTAGKHSWERTCCLADPEKLPNHVAELVEFSEIADILGLPTRTWAVRELLPVEPVATLARYQGMPLVKEARCFVSDGLDQCVHPYWPLCAIAEGLGDLEAASELYRELELTQAETDDCRSLAFRVAHAFEGDGNWSVDILFTKRGLYVTDMADAARSWHWPGCPYGPTEAKTAERGASG